MTTAPVVDDVENMSMAERLTLLPEEERNYILDNFVKDPVALQYDWKFWARPKQIAPEGDWFGWLNLAGRGYGKTRVGAEWVRDKIENYWETPIRVAGIAETKADTRDVIVEGESGVLAVFPPELRPKYEPSKRRLTWENGSQMFLYSGDEPDQLRGPQFHFAWVDELAKYQYPDEAWNMLEFGLRLGDHPQVVVTTTPRPIQLIIDMVNDPDFVITTGTSYENYGNLAARFIQRVIKKYEGTRLGEQELKAKILNDAPGALWTREILEASRRKKVPAGVQLVKIVVAIDPATTSTGESDETGIGVAALGSDGHGYILSDNSNVYKPKAWAQTAVDLFDGWEADEIIGEVNNGGDLVEVNLRTVDKTSRIPFRKVHASRGKHVRAAPVSSLFEQERVHIIGNMSRMEDQLVSFTNEGYIGGGSPDRAEWMIWAITRLMLGKGKKEHDPDDWTTVRK